MHDLLEALVRVGHNSFFLVGNLVLAWLPLLVLGARWALPITPVVRGLWVAALAAWAVATQLPVTGGGGKRAAITSMLLLLAVLALGRRARGPLMQHASAVAAIVLAVAFLPNSPYVFTDGQHLVHHFRDVGTSPAMLVLGSLAYAPFLLLGIVPYVVGLALLERHVALVARHRVASYAVIHLVVASGIYVGRIERWHSWHLATRPSATMRDLVHFVGEVETWAFVAGATVALAIVHAGAAWLLRDAGVPLDARRWVDERTIWRSLARVVVLGLWLALAFVATGWLPAAMVPDIDADAPLLVTGVSLAALAALVAASWQRVRRGHTQRGTLSTAAIGLATGAALMVLSSLVSLAQCEVRRVGSEQRDCSGRYLTWT